ncbi:MAG: ribose 5-phosphate isomerase B [Dehalococcoidia bacterium]|nr:ribose 5-phosphate isomerase B [Dehalococcoidia bacterium]
MRIVVGADHRGYQMKDVIAAHLRAAGHSVTDAGANSSDPVDYPDLAVAVGRPVQAGEAERGILVCGSGVGAVIAANKLPGIRAGLCHDTYSAHQGVEHDDMNFLCLGSRVIGEDLALEIINAFIGAKFSGEERYRRRLAKVAALEQAAAERVQG